MREAEFSNSRYPIKKIGVFSLLGPVHMSKKKPPKLANLQPQTGLFARKPGYLANFLLDVYGAIGFVHMIKLWPP